MKPEFFFDQDNGSAEAAVVDRVVADLRQRVALPEAIDDAALRRIVGEAAITGFRQGVAASCAKPEVGLAAVRALLGQADRPNSQLVKSATRAAVSIKVIQLRRFLKLPPERPACAREGRKANATDPQCLGNGGAGV